MEELEMAQLEPIQVKKSRTVRDFLNFIKEERNINCGDRDIGHLLTVYINGDVADDDDVIKEGDEVIIIPQITGGK